MPVNARQRAFPQGKTRTTLVDGAFPQGKTPTTLVNGHFRKEKRERRSSTGHFLKGKRERRSSTGFFLKGKRERRSSMGHFLKEKCERRSSTGHFYVMVNDELLMMNGGAAPYGLFRLRETQIRGPTRTIIEPKKIRRQTAHGSAPGWMELRGKGALRAAYSSFPQRRSSARRPLAYPPPGRL